MDWLASTISSGAGLLGGIITGSGSSHRMRVQRRQQEILMAKQNEYNTQAMYLQNTLANQNWQKQFDAENAYNDPAALRARLENAGYNPFVAAGSVGQTTAAANPQPIVPSAPQTSGGSVAPSDFASSVTQGVQAGTAVANSIFSGLQSREEIKNVAEDTKHKQLQNWLEQFTNEFWAAPYIDPKTGETVGGLADDSPLTNRDVYQANIIEKIKKEVHKLETESDLNSKSLDDLQQKINFFRDTYNINVDAAQQGLDNLKAEFDKINNEADVAEATAANIDADTETKNALRPHQVAKAKEEVRTQQALTSEAKADAFYKLQQGITERETRSLTKQYLSSSISKNYADAEEARQTAEYYKQNAATVKYNLKNVIPKQLEKLKAEGKLTQNELEQAKIQLQTISTYRGTKFGHAMVYVRGFLDDLGGNALVGALIGGFVGRKGVAAGAAARGAASYGRTSSYSKP